MNNLLIICGPTATGKTSLGIKLAEKFNSEIISADSRQVYKGMDIGTGKDLPVNLKSQTSNLKWNKINVPHYKINEVVIWGYDLVEPDEEFSVALFTEFSQVVLKDLWKRKTLPIAIGGTGLYLKALTETIPTLAIPINRKLRFNLNNISINKLQNRLKSINLQRFNKMNQSDKNNSRRLIRAIEVESYEREKKINKKMKKRIFKEPSSILWIGLKSNKEILFERISNRVDNRIKQGAEKEVQNLLKLGYGFNLPSMSALGYKQWEDYFEKKSTINRISEKWKQDERNYAKRQITWFKKNKEINWFDAFDTKTFGKVVKLVNQWYIGS